MEGVAAETSTGLAGAATTTVRVTGGLVEWVMAGIVGDTTCTTGDSLEGDGVDTGDTLIPGEVLAAGEDGGIGCCGCCCCCCIICCVLRDCEGVLLTNTMAVGLPDPTVLVA